MPPPQPNSAPARLPPTQPQPRINVEHLYQHAVTEKLPYKDWEHHPAQALNVIQTLQRDPHLPPATQKFYQKLLTEYQKLLTPEDQKTFLREKIIIPLTLIERTHEEARQERAQLSQNTFLRGVETAANNLAEKFTNLSPAGKTAILGLGVATLFLVKKFYNTTGGRIATGAITALGLWTGADQLLKIGSGGKYNAGLDLIWNGLREILDEGGAQDPETGGLNSYREAFAQTELKNAFLEEFPLICDVPTNRLIAKYTEIRQRQSGSPIGELTRRDLADLGIRLKKEQLNLINGRELYEMLDYLFGNTFEIERGLTPGSLRTTYRTQTISFGNFLLNQIWSTAAPKEPSLLEKLTSQALGLTGLAILPNYRLTPADQKELAYALTAAPTLAQKLANLKAIDLPTLQTHSGLADPELGALLLARQQSAWLAQTQASLQNPISEAARKRALLTYQQIEKLVETAYEPVRQAVRIEKVTQQPSFAPEFRQALTNLAQFKMRLPETGQALLETALEDRATTFTNQLAQIDPPFTNKFRLFNFESLLREAPTDPAKRRAVVATYSNFGTEFQQQIIQPLLSRLTATASAALQKDPSFQNLPTTDPRERTPSTVRESSATSFVFQLTGERDLLAKIKTLTNYLAVEQALGEIKNLI